MKRVLIIGVVVLMNVGAFAQDSTRHNVLTFEQAVKIALENGVLLAQARNNEHYNQFQKIASIAGVAPTISAYGNVGRNIGNSFNRNTGKVVQGTFDSYSAGLNANVNLFSGFSRINTIRQYSAFLEAQNYFVNRTAQDLINTVATQYLNVMLDVELMKIAQANWKILEKNLDQVREQVDLGARPPVDLYNQQALTKAAELTFVQAELQIVNDKALLAQTILMDAFEEFDTERPNWDVNTIGSETVNAQELADQAKLSRGDYQRAVYQEKGYRYQTYAARGFLAPSFGASFGYSSFYNFPHLPKQIEDSNGNLIDNPDYPLSFHDQFQKINPQKAFGLGLQIPILSGLQNRQYVVQSKVLYRNATITRQQVEFQIRNDIVKAVKNFDAAKRIYSLSAEKITYAQNALDLETQRFELGVTSFVEYNNANAVLVRAQTDRAQAEYKLVFQKIMLSYAAGTLRSEDVTNTEAPTKK